MDEDLERMTEMKAEGFYCSQIMMKLGLELQGKENPDLVRAMHALAGGIGFSGEVCGALTGAACLVGLYAGKGEAQDEEDPRLEFTVMDLVNWFTKEYGQKYGSIRCADILNNNSQNKATRCPLIVAETYQHVKEMLVENGFDLAGI
jgi:C_GCAxxG_C_C family probable redox protein